MLTLDVALELLWVFRFCFSGGVLAFTSYYLVGFWPTVEIDSPKKAEPKKPGGKAKNKNRKTNIKKSKPCLRFLIHFLIFWWFRSPWEPWEVSFVFAKKDLLASRKMAGGAECHRKGRCGWYRWGGRVELLWLKAVLLETCFFGFTRNKSHLNHKKSWVPFAGEPAFSQVGGFAFAEFLAKISRTNEVLARQLEHQRVPKDDPNAPGTSRWATNERMAKTGGGREGEVVSLLFGSFFGVCSFKFCWGRRCFFRRFTGFSIGMGSFLELFFGFISLGCLMCLYRCLLLLYVFFRSFFLAEEASAYRRAFKEHAKVGDILPEVCFEVVNYRQ